MKKLLTALVLACTLAPTAHATQYIVRFTPPFQATPEVGDQVLVFTNYGVCSTCNVSPCETACLTQYTGVFQWGIADEGQDCQLTEEWTDFAIGNCCLPPSCTNCWYEIVAHPSTNCWVLDDQACQ